MAVSDLAQVAQRAVMTDNPADAEYYPGMVNLSGVLCYMNSVLQVPHSTVQPDCLLTLSVPRISTLR